MRIALNPLPVPVSATHRPAISAATDTSAALHAVPAPRARVVKKHGWASPGSSTSPAYISLSRDHVALLRAPDGRLLTPIDLGQMELSTRQAWDSAADTLLRTQAGRIEFTVRNASFALGDFSPRGLEVRGGVHPPAAWLAHPWTFTMLHAHFSSVLSPREDLVFVSRDHRDLFVLDSDVHTVCALFPRATVFTYSLGFPVSHPGQTQ